MKFEQQKYKDSDATTEERVLDLLPRMNLEEKVAQLCTWWHTNFFMSDFNGALEKTLKNGLGGINWLIPGFAPEENVKVMNQIQQYAMEKTNLGIPVLFTGEALAGGLFYGATYFPTAIGLASTWEPELIEEMCRIVKLQMIEYGVRLVYSPVLDIARDPRWGRIGETYGEDPYLASQMGKSFVSAMQSEILSKGVACTGKHFLGYSIGEGGINKGIVNIGSRELYEVFARPFEAIIRDSGVRAIMNAYSVIDNVPVASSKAIMTDLLKQKLGFDGVVFSDDGSIQQLMTRNHSASSYEEAAVRAIKAGIDVDISEPPVYPLLNDAVKKGILDEETLNTAVEKVLTLKFDLGLFEHPYAEGNVKKTVYTTKNHAQAYRTAVKSLVLLKNDENILPLHHETTSVAVIGPNADNIRCFFGGYSSPAMRELTTSAFSGDKDDKEYDESVSYGKYGDSNDSDSFTRYFYPDTVSVLQAIRNIMSPNTIVQSVKGCELTFKSDERFDVAINAVKGSDVTIVVLGGIEGMGKDTTCGERRDRVNLSLPGCQQQLLEALCSVGNPVILVVISSNPLDLTWAKDHVQAILQAWSPGQAAGNAIADVLFGIESPGGKLPLTMPKHSGQIPIYYNRKPIFEDIDCAMDYIDGPNGCLYPFGHGLSYTEFAYGNLEIPVTQIDPSGSIVLSFEVENIGARAGDEVAQIYFHDCAATVCRPVKELVGFKRICLEPGEKYRLTFTVKAEMLAFYDADMKFVVEPGNHEVFIGSSSTDIRLQDMFEITGESMEVKQRSVFSSQVLAEKIY